MWQQLSIQVRSDQADALEEFLLAAGSLSITFLDAEDQPVFQEVPGSTPLWNKIVLVSLFDGDMDMGPIVAQIDARFGLKLPAIAITTLEDQDWERAWMKDFHPMQFGPSLWICPTWATPPDPEAINIMLDPGLAFGSGTHATTSMCLTWLESAALRGKRVIDYGSGSGVLAIAAALLGAEQVLAVDNDPQAIQATVANAHSNRVDETVLQAYLPDELPEGEADILVANILAAPLQELAPLFATLVKPGGDIVLSGLLRSQADTLMEIYSRWFVMREPRTREDWVCLSGQRERELRQ